MSASGAPGAAPPEEQRPLPAYLWKLARFLVLATGIWFGTGLVRAWLVGSLDFLFAIIFVPLLAIAFLIVTIIYMFEGARLARRPLPTAHRAAAAVAAPVMLFLLFYFWFTVAYAGAVAGSWARLMAYRSSYEEIVAKVRRGEIRRHGRLGGIEYRADDGPQLRLAFEPDGLLDNWTGIIFDPTRRVALANGFDATAAPEDVTRLFGGDLVGCRRLQGDYFYCTFT